MSKLDQLKALGDAKRVARNSSGGAAEVRRVKRGRGRPKVEGPRPWEIEGVSRRTWYRHYRKD